MEEEIGIGEKVLYLDYIGKRVISGFVSNFHKDLRGNIEVYVVVLDDGSILKCSERELVKLPE